jgi:hypothetical protein
VLAGILDGLEPAQHQKLYHVGNTLSAIYCSRELPAHQLKNPGRPKHAFSLSIKKRCI